MATEILGIKVPPSTGWVGGHWAISNRSGGYHGLLKQWCDHFGLEGTGLVIGEQGQFGENVKKAFKDKYDVEVYSVGLSNADIVWDITKPLETEKKYGWIMCQATLEHVTDPVAAVKNMANILKKGGRIYIHTVGPDSSYHAHPIDCYRFFRDALIAMAELAHLEIDDIFWTRHHCFVVYKKE